MSCYALACRQVLPCVVLATCEHIWHACDIEHHAPPKGVWRCPDCHATWTYHLGSPHGTWHRDPLKRNLTGVTQ